MLAVPDTHTMPISARFGFMMLAQWPSLAIQPAITSAIVCWPAAMFSAARLQV